MDMRSLMDGDFNLSVSIVKNEFEDLRILTCLYS